MNKKRLTPCRAIREYCSTECETNLKDVKNCQKTECPLFAYRMAHNPSRKGTSKITFKSQKREKGRFQPTAHGEKRVRLVGLEREGKLTVILPNGDTFIYEVRKIKKEE